ncbi:MAG: Na+/H+ antiporter subunit E [Clostridia bacterium]
MFFVFFLLWVVFNGRLTWEIAAFGAVLSALLYAFCCAFLDYSPKKDLAALRRIPKMFAYLGLLLSEIVKSNVALTRIVYSRHPAQIKPQLVTFRTPLKGPIVKSVLADSITLTPGTITVSMQGDELTVHCLDKSFSEGIESLAFQSRLLALEEGGPENDA